MKFSRQEVLHIARLARLGLSEAEVDRMAGQLSDILGHFETLAEVDTTGVAPTAQASAISSVTAPDEVLPSLPAEEVLANAPAREGDFFRIRAVLE